MRVGCHLQVYDRAGLLSLTDSDGLAHGLKIDTDSAYEDCAYYAPASTHEPKETTLCRIESLVQA